MSAILTAAALLFVSGQKALPVFWTGGDSKIATKSVRLIDNELDWMRTWTAHNGRPEGTIRDHSHYSNHPKERIPEIDFKQGVVVAMFMGKVYQVGGYSVLDTVEDGSTLTLRVIPRYFSVAGGRNTDKEYWARNPYGFFLLPRKYSRIRVEQGLIKDKREGVYGYDLVKEFEVPPAK